MKDLGSGGVYTGGRNCGYSVLFRSSVMISFFRSRVLAALGRRSEVCDQRSRIQFSLFKRKCRVTSLEFEITPFLEVRQDLATIL